MKYTALAFIFISFVAAGCGRVGLEESPEALVRYGVPTQHSNFDANAQKEVKRDTSIGWLDSSAIDPKPRIDL